jgi:NADH:ubiquinone oxidoreductase subunit 5 (subunit L)/multisubunit Na+/H+ antiporter MnhA subunit
MDSTGIVEVGIIQQNGNWWLVVATILVAVFSYLLKDWWSRREKTLREFYRVLSNEDYSPEVLIGGTSFMTIQPMGTQAQRMSENFLTELRSRCHYWKLPSSKIRSLFLKYQAILSTIPNLKVSEIRNTDEFIKAVEASQKITSFVDKKTGKNLLR